MAQSPCPSIRSQSSNRTRANDPETSYEVFRNNTTAIEVIVKDVAKRHKRRSHSTNGSHAPPLFQEPMHTKLGEDNQKLIYQMNNTQMRLETTRKGFSAIVAELQKQMESANKREADAQRDIIALRLENEKLKTMYETKCNVIKKLRKELLNVRRVLKFVIKNIFSVPQAIESFNVTDPEYDELEMKLKKQCNHLNGEQMAQSILDATGDTTMSKDSDIASSRH